MQCDNGSVVSILMYGRSSDLFLQVGMREVVYLQAVGEFHVKAVFIRSSENRIIYLLSHWVDPRMRKHFRQEKSLKRAKLPSELFKFLHNW